MPLVTEIAIKGISDDDLRNLISFLSDRCCGLQLDTRHIFSWPTVGAETTSIIRVNVGFRLEAAIRKQPGVVNVYPC